LLHSPNRRWHPPSRSNPELDDGLLTASKVAQLKLNADWVVLSACNTAAGDKPGAEALSGLARPSGRES
jgi:CHAT domain-containing protein